MKTAGYKITQSDIKDYNFMFYKTGELSFSNTSLPELTETLWKYYHEKIQISSEELNEIKVTTSFKDMSLDDIMSELEIILNISAQKTDDGWQLKSKE